MPSNTPSKAPIIKKRLSKKTKIQVVVATAVIFVFLVLIAADLFFGGPLTALFSNKNLIIEKIESFGIFAPIAYVVLSTVETVVAPIPGQIVGLIGGFLFGWVGVFLNLIATGIGCFIIFSIARRFGRPLVERLIKKDTLDKFDYLTKEKGGLIFFLIFLIPGLPDDIVCYIAGLTEIPIKKLLALVLIGRFPALVMTNFIGSGLGEDEIAPVVIATVITCLILAVMVVKREKIMSYLANKKSKK